MDFSGQRLRAGSDDPLFLLQPVHHRAAGTDRSGASAGTDEKAVRPLYPYRAFVLAIAGTAAGSAVGWMATDRAVKATESTTEFDTTFSNTIIDSGDDEETDFTAAGQKTGAEMAVAAGCGMMLAAVLISFGFMRQTLKKEPLQILGELEE